MNDLLNRPTPGGKLPLWNYTPPKWWRVSYIALPFAVFAEAIALFIAIGPHVNLPGIRPWGIAFCLGIPTPLIWLRNGNRHLRDIAVYKEIDPTVLKLISYFSVGIVATSYMLITFIIANLLFALKMAR